MDEVKEKPALPYLGRVLICYHRRGYDGQDACGKPAFYWLGERPVSFVTVLASKNMAGINGEEYAFGEVMHCSSCGKPMGRPFAEDFE